MNSSYMAENYNGYNIPPVLRKYDDFVYLFFFCEDIHMKSSPFKLAKH